MALTERLEAFERVKLASSWSMVEFIEQLEARLEYCTWEIFSGHGEKECKRERLLCPEMNYSIPLDTMSYNDESSRATLVTAMYREISP